LSKRTVLSADDISRAITRISHEIVEANHGLENLVLLGIPTRGVFIANRLAEVIHKHSGVKIDLGSLDITLYRDDLAKQPTRGPGLRRSHREELMVKLSF
jgi:pyrimidine operon attenuation protein/uracil phosphoribosyltransferase